MISKCANAGFLLSAINCIKCLDQARLHLSVISPCQIVIRQFQYQVARVRETVIPVKEILNCSYTPAEVISEVLGTCSTKAAY